MDTYYFFKIYTSFEKLNGSNTFAIRTYFCLLKKTNEYLNSKCYAGEKVASLEVKHELTEW